MKFSKKIAEAIVCRGLGINGEISKIKNSAYMISGITGRTVKDMFLTLRGHLSISKDVNKICFDDYAHTVH